MALALLPTSKIFRAGSRIRVTIAGADPRQRNLRELRVEVDPAVEAPPDRHAPDSSAQMKPCLK